MEPQEDKTIADQVRLYCAAKYIKPARQNKEYVAAIRTGDVHTAMQFSNRLPAVCAALGATVFEDQNGIRRIAVDGPLNGSNTLFVFRILYNN
jgi:hypothetical protein